MKRPKTKHSTPKKDSAPGWTPYVELDDKAVKWATEEKAKGEKVTRIAHRLGCSESNLYRRLKLLASGTVTALRGPKTVLSREQRLTIRGWALADRSMTTKELREKARAEWPDTKVSMTTVWRVRDQDEELRVDKALFFHGTNRSVAEMKLIEIIKGTK